MQDSNNRIVLQDDRSAGPPNLQNYELSIARGAVCCCVLDNFNCLQLLPLNFHFLSLDDTLDIMRCPMKKISVPLVGAYKQFLR